MKAIKTHCLIAVCLLSSILFIDCKRGEDDPVFSLRSRRNRLKGEWVLQKAKWINNDTTVAFENDLILTTMDTITSDSLTASIVYNFELSGRYTIKSEYSYPGDFNNSNNLAFQLTNERIGIWNFNNGSSEDPNKSKLILIEEKVEETSSITGSNVEAFEIEGATIGFLYSIKELRYDKLVLEYNKSTLTEAGTSVSNGTLSFVKN